MLNTVDKPGLVHEVRRKPSYIENGMTKCNRTFSWPLYSLPWALPRWLATDARVTCLECITCP